MFKGTIRELKEEDAEVVKGILGLYWDGELKERFIQRMMGFLDKTPESVENKYKYFVAEENGEIVGVAVSRNAPEHMKQYVETSNPVEFYLLAVKDRNRGTGTTLEEKMLGEARNDGYTEAILYSAESPKILGPFMTTLNLNEPVHLWFQTAKKVLFGEWCFN